jgi:hypothetical protein
MYMTGRIITVLVLFFSFIHFSSTAQQFIIKGKIVDETDNSELIGVSVIVSPQSDTSNKNGTATDADGNFTIIGLSAGSYRLTARYVGFQNYSRDVQLVQDLNLGTIKLKVLSTQLQNVNVTAEQIRAQQSGDTTSFNAGAYKTNPDANAEDLINKMPGLSTEGGTLKAHGEDVKKVLVDGKEFFGDDPNAAIKNLPSEIIDRIQVFDKLSDQAQLTGFSDGNEQRTINIITKPGRNTGQFGKLFGGIGSRDFKSADLLYTLGGNINFFKADTRISLIGLSNNVNQQNFSTDDLLGVVGTSSAQNRGGGGPRGGGFQGGGRGGFSGGRGGQQGSDGGRTGGDISSFLIGQQPGVTITHSVGINYSDNWSKKVKASGSYFFNSTDNENTTSLARNYFAGTDSSIIYKETSSSNTKNLNHRANLRIEYEMDSANSIIFSPRISFQQNEKVTDLSANTKEIDSSLLNNTKNRNTSDNDGYNVGGNLTFRHKFEKKGRTASINLNGSLNSRNGGGTTYSKNNFFNPDTSYLINQQYSLESSTNNISANITYTEPLNSNSQLMLNYNPSLSKSKSDRETMDKDTLENLSLNPTLSNKYENTYNTHKAGATYQYNNPKSMFSIGVTYQQANLNGMQIYPFDFEVDRSFSNFLPNAMYNYKFTRTQNLRVMYRTNTNPPTISQLQNVLDVTNPLIIKTGNPDLKQDYTHTLIFRYGNTNTTTSRNFFAVLFGSYVMNYIANETVFPTNNSSIHLAGDINFPSGSQLTRPVNLDGYFMGRSFLTFGLPVRKIKSNLNLNIGLNYNRLPGRIRYASDSATLFSETAAIDNIANNYTMNGGVVLSSNISENIDFTFSYSGYYNIVKNTIQTGSDNNYYNQNTSLKFNWIVDRLVFNTTAIHTLYSGLSQGFNQSYLLWNAGLGYKFLADKSLDLRLNVYDVLNQNKSINRTVTETYIEDSYTNVLQRYFMLNLTYTLRRFGNASLGKRSNNTEEGANPDRPYRNRGNRTKGEQ